MASSLLTTRRAPCNGAQQQRKRYMPARQVSIHAYFLLYRGDIVIVLTVVTPLHTIVSTAFNYGFILYASPPRVPRYRLRYPKAQ